MLLPQGNLMMRVVAMAFDAYQVKSKRQFLADGVNKKLVGFA